jgi:hypothetical protein
VRSMTVDTALAEIAAIAEGVERYRARVVDLVTPELRAGHEDLVAAIYEAERALRQAGRQLVRAEKVGGD